ncbi:MAG: hypothetical protein EB126_06235 [Synechococcaceae bacterium WBB_10_009]|nr:hypothetical protein [Synechococcaceae bacterium WBB_10_009]
MDPNARPLDEAQRQCDLLLAQQEQLTPELYRDLALYLQVLREGLLHAVQQACFHLATQVAPERYSQLPSARRLAFQRRLEALVQRCNALLTVEQLMGLAAQQQRRDHRRHRLSQQQLLQRLLQEGEAQADPPGQQSVHLSLDLPLAADLFDQGVPGLPALRPPASATPAPPTPSEPPAPAEAADGEGSGSLRLMQSLFQMASEELQDPAPDTEAEEPSAAMAAGLDPRVTATTVPRDPLLQLRWWTHLDRALRRRLRNLSHAVNVELLRVGLAQGLLPMGLLDAVLDGQLEALPAPANLLRLPLPVPEGHALEASMPTQVLALLLRQGDLEFEQPRLRSCRKRLEQRRRTLRTMAKRYGGWQRRLRALQAEQQWFQDTAPPQNPPPAHR